MKKSLSLPTDKKIVAIDFDGTITKQDHRIWDGNNSSNDIMEPNLPVINWVKQNRKNMYLILWSCRVGKDLEKAVTFCKELGIEFDSINENILIYECSPKIMADIYLDDKCFRPMDLEEIKL